MPKSSNKGIIEPLPVPISCSSSASSLNQQHYQIYQQLPAFPHSFPPGVDLNERYMYIEIKDEDLKAPPAAILKLTAPSPKGSSSSSFFRRCNIRQASVAIGFALFFIWVVGYIVNENIYTFFELDYFVARPGNHFSSMATKITLSGDSLINKPFESFDLSGLIQLQLPQHPLMIYNEGSNGNTIAAIRQRLDSILSHESKMMIMFWDTDCSDTNEKTMSEGEVLILRQKYEENLRFVISTSLSSGIEKLAVAGPGLLGEGSVLLSPRFEGKGDMLDAYVEINRRVSIDMGVEFIDVRKVLLENIPVYWVFNRWYLTLDGEHLNRRGTKIVASLFADTISRWLET